MQNFKKISALWMTSPTSLSVTAQSTATEAFIPAMLTPADQKYTTKAKFEKKLLV